MSQSKNKTGKFLPPPAYFSECYIKIYKFRNPNCNPLVGGGQGPISGGPFRTLADCGLGFLVLLL